jgi:poly-gamma-glutamate capsule biosynthesis protein CapA/YwtB (metallophosphatase superfamily)
VQTWTLASSRLLLALAQQAAAPPPISPPPPRAPVVRGTLRLFAVGDLNLGRAVTWDYLLKGDTLYPFDAVRDTLAAADILFGNLESPIAPVGHPYEHTGSPVFSAPPVAADALVRAGFDVVSTANNHAWDAGLTGVFETVKQLDRVHLPHVGTGRTLADAHQPAIIVRNGWRVAFFAVTRAYNPAPGRFYTHIGSHYIAYADSAWLYPAIRRIKASGAADFVVVSIHAGTELADHPDEPLRQFLLGAVDAGADLCLGHHPHVLQPVEWYRGKPIVYSMGNFIFKQGAPWTAYSGVFTFTVAPDGRVTADVIPVRSGFQARFASRSAADSIRRRVGLVGPLPLIFFTTLP